MDSPLCFEGVVAVGGLVGRCWVGAWESVPARRAPYPALSHRLLLFHLAIDLHRFAKNGGRYATETQLDVRANTLLPAWEAKAQPF